MPKPLQLAVFARESSPVETDGPPEPGDKPILRVLTPVLRPLFRWNHNWAIARAMEGLQPWARRRASERSAQLVG